MQSTMNASTRSEDPGLEDQLAHGSDMSFGPNAVGMPQQPQGTAINGLTQSTGAEGYPTTPLHRARKPRRILFEFPAGVRCDQCRRGAGHLCQVQAEGSSGKCTRCIKFHTTCTRGGVNPLGEIHGGKRAKGVAVAAWARFNGVGFSIVQTSSPDWGPIFLAIETATTFFKQYGVVVHDPDALAAKTSDCQIPGAHPTEWPAAAHTVLLGLYGARFSTLPSNVTATAPSLEPPVQDAYPAGQEFQCEQRPSNPASRTIGKRPRDPDMVSESTATVGTPLNLHRDISPPRTRMRVEVPFIDLRAVHHAYRRPRPAHAAPRTPSRSHVYPLMGTSPSESTVKQSSVPSARPKAPSPGLAFEDIRFIHQYSMVSHSALAKTIYSGALGVHDWKHDGLAANVLPADTVLNSITTSWCSADTSNVPFPSTSPPVVAPAVNMTMPSASSPSTGEDGGSVGKSRSEVFLDLNAVRSSRVKCTKGPPVCAGVSDVPTVGGVITRVPTVPRPPASLRSALLRELLARSKLYVRTSRT
ncbi:hypothetical protein C8Q79DRAFT_989696 [Trametes meyenii]|nr:hypothetical protein C8Q79DRAFT_989696 [Trametes meyenii]